MKRNVRVIEDGSADMAKSGRALKVLEAVAENSRLTQRGLASRLGIAVGLTNLYLKRLAHKGYIKFVNVRPNRILYLLTPKGIAEKTRLTYEFMECSLVLYRQVRTHMSTIVLPCVRRAGSLALYGTGEAAELAYLCLRENGLELNAVFDDERGRFLGMPVHAIRDHAAIPFDVLIVARLEQPDEMVAELVRLGIPKERLVTLRPPRSSKEPRTNGKRPAVSRQGQR
jgi:DNA-binding MarR family transcriptional regulator